VKSVKIFLHLGRILG